jgi:hypothetical protein
MLLATATAESCTVSVCVCRWLELQSVVSRDFVNDGFGFVITVGAVDLLIVVDELGCDLGF